MRNHWNLTVAALVISATIVLTSSPVADAKPTKGGGGGSVKPLPKPHPGNKGPASSKGGQGSKQTWAGKSRPSNFNGWTKHCHFPQYGCRGYYAPEDATWYYWYE